MNMIKAEKDVRICYDFFYRKRPSYKAEIKGKKRYKDKIGNKKNKGEIGKSIEINIRDKKSYITFFVKTIETQDKIWYK